MSVHGPAVQSHVLITFRFISLAPISDPSMVLLAPVPFPFDSVVSNTSLFLSRCDSSMADMMGVSGSVICSNVNEKNSAPDYSKLPSNKRSHNKVKEIISLNYCITDWGSYKKMQPLFKDFSRITLDFQGPSSRNIISQIVQKCTFPVYSNNCLLHQLPYILQFTCLKLIVNYCIKHRALYINNL